MNKPRCTLSAVSSPDCQFIYAIGGFNGQPLNSVERFDVTREDWEEAPHLIPSMKEKRFMHSCIIVSSGQPGKGNYL